MYMKPSVTPAAEKMVATTVQEQRNLIKLLKKLGLPLPEGRFSAMEFWNEGTRQVLELDKKLEASKRGGKEF